MKKIIKNSIRCNHCGDTITSTHPHDFVTCKCGCCSIDGGNKCLRRLCNDRTVDYTELSEFEAEEDDGYTSR